MSNEYIIINKTKVLEEIEELKASLNYIPESYIPKHLAQIYAYEQVLLRSTPLIPEIDKAIEFGKDIRSEKSFINNNFGSPFLDYEDSTEETIRYISNLKLDV